MSKEYHKQIYEIIVHASGVDTSHVQYGITEFAKGAHMHDDETNLEKIQYFSRKIANWAQYKDVLTTHISREKLDMYGLSQIFSEMVWSKNTKTQKHKNHIKMMKNFI